MDSLGELKQMYQYVGDAQGTVGEVGYGGYILTEYDVDERYWFKHDRAMWRGGVPIEDIERWVLEDFEKGNVIYREILTKDEHLQAELEAEKEAEAAAREAAMTDEERAARDARREARAEEVRQEETKALKLYENTRRDYIYIEGSWTYDDADDFWENMRVRSEVFEYSDFKNLLQDFVDSCILIHKDYVFESDALTLAMSRWYCTIVSDTAYWTELRMVEREYGSNYALKVFLQDNLAGAFRARR